VTASNLGLEALMEIELQARVYALELLTTQLISEYLRTVPDPAAQAKWAREHLHGTVDVLTVEVDTLDDEARLRVGIKSEVSRILEMALVRASATPLVPRSRCRELQKG
jgi:hypothetical protein